MTIKNIIGNFIRKFLTNQIYRIIRGKPLIVPSYYKEIIEDIENVIDYQCKEIQNTDQEIALIKLRKDSHIIDKGLQRKDAKAGHSNKIYLQAKNNLSKIKDNGYYSDESIKWCINKIKDYELLQKGHKIEGEKEILYYGNYDDIFSVIKSRRSSRFYLDKEITSSDLRKIFEPINWAASSCNKQPIKVFSTIKKELITECLKQCKGATAFSKNIPAFATICVDMRGYVLPSEMYLPMIDASLGTQNSVLAAHTMGISCTILSWAQKDKNEDKRLRELLSIPEHFGIIFNMTMGYPEINASVPKRKSIDSTLVIR